MNVAICDDQKECRDIIIKYMKPFVNKDINITVSEFCCGEDLLSVYERGKKYDLIFMDVEMKLMSGVETSKKIREIDKNAILIFVTMYSQYVPDAFILNAFQFLVKPIKQDLFDKEFERAININIKNKFKYKITYKGITTLIKAEDIIYIETYNRHLQVITYDMKYEFLGNISSEYKKLSQYDFVQCHQGYIVNMHHIKALKNNSFILQNGQQIPISKHLKNIVISQYNKLISGCCL